MRANDWWNNIIPPILGFFALGQLSAEQDYTILFAYGVVFLLMILIAVFGFFIGEWSDIKDDQIVGKSNLLANRSLGFKTGMACFTLAGIGILTHLLNVDISVKLLVVLQLLCFLLYSIPPFRLKRNKYASLILDSLYSGTIMYVMVMALGSNCSYLMLGLLFLWGILRGQRNYILHTLNDAENDNQIGIKSIGNTYQYIQIIKIQNSILFPLEIISLLAFLYLVEMPYNLILMASYLLIIGYSFYHRSISEKMGSYGHLSNINLFHEMLFPLVVLVLLTLEQIFWIIPLLLLMSLFTQYKQWGWAIIKKIGGN